jgi:hypothetical protein
VKIMTAGMEHAVLAVMSLGFVLAACAFALVLGCAVAWVDRWREARLREAPLKAAAPATPLSQGATGPNAATERRAA